MRRAAVATLAAVLALAGCGPVVDQQAPAAPSETAPATPPPGDVSEPDPAPSAPAEGRPVSGTLNGDAQLEGGCVWVETADGNIEPMLPEGFSATTDPVALVGPDGDVVAEIGDEVTITGAPAPDVLTTCQVGEVWRVSAVTLAED